MSKDNVFFLGVLDGFLMALAIFYDDTEQAELQAIVDGGDLCMSLAGSMHCHMTPGDFIEYYEAKNELTASE